MKRLIITTAVAVAALGGVGATLVAAAWPDGSADSAGPLAIAAPAAVDAPAGAAAASPGPTTMDSTGAVGTVGSAQAAAAPGTAAGGPGEAPGDTTAGTDTAGTAAGTSGTSAAGAAADPTAPAGDPERTCGLGGWDARVQGRPAGFAGGDRAGDYLWHDAAGFHLRVTHRGDRRDVFTGVITADRQLALRPVRLEGRDAVALSADRRTLSYRFYDYGHIDGADFGTDCATRLVVGDLRLDGRRLGTGRVYLGRTQAHPAQLPFTLTRTAS
jgi:hypothetical protein